MKVDHSSSLAVAGKEVLSSKSMVNLLSASVNDMSMQLTKNAQHNIIEKYC